MGEPFGGAEQDKSGRFKGWSHISFQHALIKAADLAHQERPGAHCTVAFEIILGSNPPINEYQVILAPDA